ncbi:hypothetical protein K440DRAFT_636263 [Wilcoxina mikolae CBS 423.85]|nr:hypothetical protein K440DRAFT_636263 [Wilcoxina mikolae CBS 423.85]
MTSDLDQVLRRWERTILSEPEGSFRKVTDNLLVRLIVGLTGLFITTLKVIDHILSASTYNEDSHLFVTKVSTKRVHFFLWGQTAGLTGSPQPHELLQDPVVAHEVRKLLEWAIYFFENSEAMTERHRPTRGLITFLPARSSSTTALDHSRGSAVILQRKTSMTGKMKWAFLGKKKCEKLLQEISWFVDKLHELVPTSGIQQHRSDTPAAANLSSQVPNRPSGLASFGAQHRRPDRVNHVFAVGRPGPRLLY